jgi:hypothetical protein
MMTVQLSGCSGAIDPIEGVFKVNYQCRQAQPCGRDVTCLGCRDKLLALIPNILALVRRRDDCLRRPFNMVLPMSRHGHSGDPADPLRHCFIAAPSADHLRCDPYLCSVGTD